MKKKILARTIKFFPWNFRNNALKIMIFWLSLKSLKNKVYRLQKIKKVRNTRSNNCINNIALKEII